MKKYDKLVKEMIGLKLTEKEKSRSVGYFLKKYKIKRNVLVDIAKDVLTSYGDIIRNDDITPIRWSVKDDTIDRINKHKAWRWSITIAIISVIISVGSFYMNFLIKI